MSCANSTCKNCNDTCNTAQTFCPTAQSAKSYGGTFSWPVTPEEDVTAISDVWTETSWNALKAAIDKAYQKGTNSTVENKGCSSQG